MCSLRVWMQFSLTCILCPFRTAVGPLGVDRATPHECRKALISLYGGVGMTQ